MTESPTLLLVDDDDLDRESARRMLQKSKISQHIFEASTIQEATRLLASHPIDCAVVDLSLPDGSGLSLASGAVAVVIVTGHQDQARAALQAGAEDYLTKDELEPQLLARSIRYAIERRQFQQLKQTLAHQERLMSLGRLAASVAHEINNPLAFITANLSLLQELHRHLGPAFRALSREGQRDPVISEIVGRVPPQELEEADEIIEESQVGAQRIAALVRQMRSFAHDSSTEEEPREVAVSEVVRWSVALTSRDVQSKARLEQRIDANLPPLFGRVGQLAQALTNLLMNAAQAVPEDDPAHQLVLLSAWADANWVYFSVEDSGPGMSDEVKRRALEPFFTTKPPSLGTGLGLYIVSDIVSKHGGRIELLDRPSGGARVLLTFPRYQPPANPAPERAQPAPPEEVPLLRILLIDDEPSLRQAYPRILKPHEVVAEDAEGAVQRLFVRGDHDFDVILCDLTMPGRDGLSILEEARACDPALAARFILLTGGVLGARAELAHSQIPSLLKPVKRADILAAAHQVLRQTVPPPGRTARNPAN